MSDAEIVLSSEQLLGLAKAEADSIESLMAPALFRALLPVADRLVQAKQAYERETGTGHGKRNPNGHPPFRAVAASVLERSESFVERLVQLSRLDSHTRELVAAHGKLIANQDALVALAREPSVDRRRLAVEAFAADGRSAFDRTLARLVDPVDLDAVDETAVTGFLTNYTEAKAAAAEARDTERTQSEPRSWERRRKNARIVFEYLHGGERKIDDAARERMGLTKSACKRAIEDLRTSDIIQSTGHLDSFEVFDGRDISQLVFAPRKPKVIVVLRPGEPPVKLKVTGGQYEFTAVADGAIRVTLCGV